MKYGIFIRINQKFYTFIIFVIRNSHRVMRLLRIKQHTQKARKDAHKFKPTYSQSEPPIILRENFIETFFNDLL
jgi:hypothetical protein